VSRKALAILFVFLLGAFTGVVKLADFVVTGAPVPFEITDMRFPLFWAIIGTWAVNAAKARQRENSEN